ncbi:mitochondrial carrier [Schizophyllum commune H4-8]|nr:mitochondrial carrier [Schizophyllum commune H4-8]KAI5897389.1 mitochondrial carrier [Schizophyllum commune H4-8]
MQTLEHNPGVARPSFLSTLRLSLSERGFFGLYTGLSASVMRQMSYSLVRIGSYEKMKAALGKDKKPSNLSLLAAASVAGAMGGLAGNPADVLLVRMTSDTVRPIEQRYNYSNAISGLVRLVKEEGAQALGRGLGTNVTRAVLMNASQVGSYDFFKTSLLGWTLPGTEYKFGDNLVTHSIASLAAGTFATTVCSPADVLRSRIMASTDHSLVHVLQKSLREEGARFLFKGWLPAFIRLGPNTVLLFVFFEQLKNGWRKLVE